MQLAEGLRSLAFAGALSVAPIGGASSEIYTSEVQSPEPSSIIVSEVSSPTQEDDSPLSEKDKDALQVGLALAVIGGYVLLGSRIVHEMESANRPTKYAAYAGYGAVGVGTGFIVPPLEGAIGKL